MELATQPELFPPGALPEGDELLIPESRQRELYPLTTVARNQERLQSIIFLLGRNAPKQFIIRSQGVGWHTLQRIAQQHGEKIADIKRKCAAKAALFVELGIEELLEKLQAGELDADKLAFTVKMVFDIMQLATGDPTSILGTSDSRPRITAESLKQRLADMKRAVPIDVPATGSDVENVLPIAAAPSAGSPVPDSQSTKS